MTKQLSDLLMDQIRRDKVQNDDELRESLRRFGWVKELPALADEQGHILVGNRRLRLAGDLGIPSVVKTVTFGHGDQADAEKVKLAIASNIGNAKMSKRDRRRIAEYLYTQRKWTEDAISKALGVAKGTVSKDLSGVVSNGNNSGGKGGRPKGAAKRRDMPAPGHDKAREVVRPFVEANQSINREELSAKTGLGLGTIQRAELAERAAKEAREDPIIDPKTLSLSAQEKLAAALRQQRKQEAADFDRRVSEGVQRMLNDTVLPQLNKMKATANAIVQARRGVMKRDMFRKILGALHPDSRQTYSDERLTELREAFEKLEVVLVSGKELPIDDAPFPRTYDDLMAMRRRGKNGATAAR